MKKNTSSQSQSSNATSNTENSESMSEENQSKESGSDKSASAKKGNSKSIKDVFHEELKDIYGAEKQLIKALPKMAEAASSPDLKQAIKDHLEQTKEHAKRIEKVFGMMSVNREAKKCKAMEGLISEGEEIISDFEKGSVRDCALIIGSQKIEHYEIAAYGSLCEIAEVMGLHQIAEILDETLEEEEETDKKLTELSETTNDEAMEEVDMN